VGDSRFPSNCIVIARHCGWYVVTVLSTQAVLFLSKLKWSCDFDIINIINCKVASSRKSLECRIMSWGRRRFTFVYRGNTDVQKMEFRRLDKPRFVYDHCCLSVLLFLLAPLILISSTRSISYQLSVMGKQPPVYYSLCTANCSLFTVL
jgi:hypothetical protein